MRTFLTVASAGLLIGVVAAIILFTASSDAGQITAVTVAGLGGMMMTLSWPISDAVEYLRKKGN